MKATTPLTRFVFSSILFATAGICVAQGPPGHDPYNPPPGHGGVPPGQAKKHDHDDDHMPPGQAKKFRETTTMCVTRKRRGIVRIITFTATIVGGSMRTTGAMRISGGIAGVRCL